MGDDTDNRHLLAAASSWRATPGDYSSLRFLRFDEDGSAELTYAYGQTIYAVVLCRWELPTAGRLRLMYTAVTRGRLAAAFTLTDDNRVKELGYTLTEGLVVGVENVVPNPYEFNWTLELTQPPWPTGLGLPYEVPKVFFGRVAEVSR